MFSQFGEFGIELNLITYCQCGQQNEKLIWKFEMIDDF